MIDLSGLTKFGNMTSGGGIASVFDSSASTTGYSQSASGYSGVSFPNGQRISYIEVVSATNGFDASGLTTQITLTLYGKTGSAPASQTDGVTLGSMTFQDANAQTTKTIQCTDQQTMWDHVWVSVQTGVWAVIAEFRLYEPAIQSEPVPSQAPIAVYQRACNQNYPLTQAVNEVVPFRTDIAVCCCGVALIDFSINVAHVGSSLQPMYLGVVGIGASIVYKRADTYEALASSPWLMPEISRTNGINIDELNPAHYANVCMPTSIPLYPGFYRFGVMMSAHSYGDPRDGIASVLAESGKGLNGLRITVINGGEHINMNS